MKQIIIDVSKFMTGFNCGKDPKIKINISIRNGKSFYIMMFKNNFVLKSFIKVLIDVIFKI